MKAFGKNIIYVVIYEETPFLAFNDFDSAKNWLEKERGAKQIQGYFFTKGFSIKDMELV